MAVIDAEEITFVDGQGYAVRDGVGGRPILLAWHPAKPQERAALIDAVPCEVVYYKHGLRDVQRQLVGEFAGALKQLDQKYRDTEIPACGAKIISIRASVSD